MVNYQRVKEAYEMLLVLSNKTALRIVDIITENPGLSVTDIYIKMRLPQSTVSTFLKNLKETGVIKSEEVGKNRFYYIDEERILQLNKILSKFGDTCINYTVKDFRRSENEVVRNRLF
jgi:ArsR family transcriptional regulator, virulence genes transcriptional regulator